MAHRLNTILKHLNYEENITTQLTSGTDSNEDVVILGIARTPMGGFNGSLSSLSAVQLGSISIKAALERSKVDPAHVDTVYMGNVLQADEGQAPARQAALAAGLPNSIPCTTVNKVCASGMKAIMLAASEIKLGTAKVAIAGGMESMSNVPYYLPKARQGLRLGDGKVIDGMMKDGLSDPYGKCAMGVIAEKVAVKYKVERNEQDDHAESSYRRATKAWEEGKFRDVIVPVKVTTRKGNEVVMEDEEFRRIDYENFRKLRPAFGGKTVTAANSSTISDGAAAVVLASASYAKEHGLTPLATIKSWADAATEPDEFPVAPSLAIPIALKRAGITKENVDFYELNEAFSVVISANSKILGIPAEKVNIYGGAVSLGHPIGCSGCRIVVELINILHQNSGKYGCAAICNGGGGASAIVLQR